MHDSFGDKTFCLIMIFTIAWTSWRKSDDNDHGHGHSHEEEPGHAHGHEKHDDVLLSPR